MLRCHILKLCVCGAFFFCTAAVFSQTAHDVLSQDARFKNLNEVDRIYYEALFLHNPDKVPAQIRDLVHNVEKCGFSLVQRIQSNWEKFSDHQRDMLAAIGRVDMPFSYIAPSGLFKIHYDTAGVDAVSSEDLDNSGVPDYIEAAGVILDEVFDVEINQLGFNPPPGDLGLDGPEWDIFIRNISGVYGYVLRDQQISSDPDTYSSSMYLDNDYTHTRTKGLDGLRVTAAHEFNHMIQLGYIWRDDDRNGSCDDIFLMEALSTYIEDKVYDDINDYYHYLDFFFSNTNKPFTYIGSDHEYALCIWFHFLEKILNDYYIGRTVLEQVVEYPAVDALDHVLISRGSGFDEALTLFYGWNYMTGQRADTDRFYPEGDAYPMIKLDSVISFKRDTALTVVVNFMASRYYEFQAEDASYTLIPTNINRNAGSTTKNAVLSLVYRDSSDIYTDLGNGIYTRLISEDPVPWRCAAAVIQPDEDSRIVLFDEAQGGTTGTISGVAWIDQNLDGIRQASFEPAIPDMRIELVHAGEDLIFDTEDDPINTAVWTDGEGRFIVSVLPAGYYRIQPDQTTVPSAYEPTTHHDPLIIYLSEGETYNGANFGYRLPDLPVSIPNPFVFSQADQVKFPFYLQVTGSVRLLIFSAAGYKVVENEMDFNTAGIQTFSWDGLDRRGRPVASGIYVYMILGEGLIREGKFAVIH